MVGNLVPIFIENDIEEAGADNDADDAIKSQLVSDFARMGGFVFEKREEDKVGQ
jgi:hypothetical protein